MDDLTQFDLLLDDGSESRGYLVSWESTESEPFALVIEEQAVPESVSANQEDENYGFRDLQDTWRVSYTNFSGGEGQERRDVTGGTPVKYHKSSNIDTSMPGALRLHHALRQLEYSGLTSLLGPTSVFGTHLGRIIWSREGRSPSQFMSLGSYYPETGAWAHWAPISANIWPRVTALASDGSDLYVACTEGDDDKQGIWKYSDPLLAGTLLNQTTDVACKTIDRMCVSAGILYLSSGGQIGYLKFVDSTPDYYVFEPLSPVTLTTGRTCFGMVASETWVYVGMTSGSKSVIYRTQWNPAEQIGDVIGIKHFEQYAELPEGFVGTTLVESLDNIFVAGAYRGRHGADGQGIVYLVTENGIALLCRIGDDPNEKVYLEDWDRNQIIAGYASEHWLYLLTKRALYRWNVRSGGLNQIADIGVLPPLIGSHGTVLTTPWDYAASYWEGYVHDTFLPDQMPTLDLVEIFSAMDSEWDDIRRSPLYATAGGTEVTGVRVNSNTKDKYGQRRFHRYRLRDTTFTYEDGGALEFVGSDFWRNCLELEVTSDVHCACIGLRGAEDSDVVRIYYYDSNGGRTQLSTVDDKAAEHSFFLSCDPVSGMANLWIDGADKPKSWKMPVSTYEPGVAYTFGADRLVTTETQDWSVVPHHLRWAGGDGYVPGWTSASGTVGAFSFAVVDGLPYVPSAPAPPSDTSGNSLITLDWDKYAERGELLTSVSSAQMPTVDKYVTALDVHYDTPVAGDRMEVMPMVNGTTMAYPLIITGDDDGNVKSLPLRGIKGSEVQLSIVLLSAYGKTTPVFRGGSLRFNPLDNSYYLLRLDLRDARKDNTGRMTDTTADIAFLKEVAESKRVVTMTSPMESCRVRVSTLQFLAAAPLRGAEVNPQGIALVKLKRVT